MLASSSRLDLAEAVDVGVEVQVDAQGRADVGTLRLDGTLSGSARDAITQWIQDARFEPARKGGVSVAGVFRTRVSSQRMGRP